MALARKGRVMSEYIGILQRKAGHPYGFVGYWDVLLTTDGDTVGRIISERPYRFPLEALQEMRAMYNKMNGLPTTPSILCSKCNKEKAVVFLEGKFVCESCASSDKTMLLMESNHN